MHMPATTLPSAPPPPFAPEVFQRRRERLLERIGNGVALIPAAPELLSSRDTDVPYRSGSDLYYLTGFREPQTLAVIAGHDAGESFTLFVRPREPAREVWTGIRLGVEGALAATGATAAYPIGELEARLFDLVVGADAIHYPVGADTHLDEIVRDMMVRARQGRARSGVGPVAVRDLEATLGEMRRIKGPEELERMRAAARIAMAGHEAARAVVRPGVGEWEVQAALEAAFRAHGADGPAFPSIVGSGPNATVLHYTANDRRIEEGDLVLIDAGAAWGLYCSDITRTIPASGGFSEPQQDVYDVVDTARRAAIDLARPGSSVAAMHDAAVRVLCAGLLDLGLLAAAGVDEVVETAAYKRYFMHQTSHWLGLDVHDPGLYREGAEPVTLQPGMVLTVEPGLYLSAGDEGLPEEFRGIGVRIEDSVVVTDGEPEVITRGA